MDGTSSVIGVILMVAITVILAAVIAAFVFYLGYKVDAQHNVGVTITRVSSDVIEVMTLNGETNMLLSGGVSHTDSTKATYTVINANTGTTLAPVKLDGSPLVAGDTYDASTIGSVMYFPVSSSDDITIIAHFADDSVSAIFSGLKK